MSTQEQLLEPRGHATRLSPMAWTLIARCQKHYRDRDGVCVPASKLVEAALRAWAPAVLGTVARPQVDR